MREAEKEEVPPPLLAEYATAICEWFELRDIDDWEFMGIEQRGERQKIEERAIERYKQELEKEARITEIREALLWCERSDSANEFCKILAKEVRRLAAEYEQETFDEPNK